MPDRIGSMRPKKLRTKLLVTYVAAGVVPLLVVSLVLYSLSAESIEDASRQFASMYISEVINALEEFEDRYEQSTRSVVAEASIVASLSSRQPPSMDQTMETRAQIKSFLVKISESDPRIRSVTLVTEAGTVYSWCTEPDSVMAEELLRQPWFRNRDDKGEPPLFIVPVHNKSYYSNRKDGYVFTVGRRLWSYTGAYLGVILFDLLPDQLFRLNRDFLELGQKYAIRLRITDKAGAAVYDSSAVTGAESWESIARANQNGSADSPRPGSSIDLTSSSSSGRFQVKAEIPLQKLLARIDAIRWVIVLLDLVLLLGVIALSMSFSRRITHPILLLQASMRRVEEGDYSSVIGPVRTHDEIEELVASYNTMLLRMKALIQDVYIAGIEQKRARIEALQAQINPHMLYNTLESIRMKALVNSQDEIASMIKSLARMFRHALQADSDTNLVRNEIDYVKDYLFLQNVRYNHAVTLVVDLPDAVLDTPVLPLIFQPLVENSLVHGLMDPATSLGIHIEGRLVEGTVTIRIIDDGAGITSDKERELAGLKSGSEQHTDGGIGLANIAQRLRLTYGNGYGLRVLAGNPGVIVEVRIPEGGPR